MLSPDENMRASTDGDARRSTSARFALVLAAVLTPFGLVAALVLVGLAGAVGGIALLVLLFAMWLGAAVLAWAVAHRLVLRPIARLHHAVNGWRPADGAIDIPGLSSSSKIGDLAAAFSRIAAGVSTRERELEAGSERQRVLVREVHHRVKNNLQVVASLLNLHARGARTPEAAAAYASILRRVDALAVVHRNHFAEMEENQGLSLRTLLSELTANLRGNAAPGAERMTIALDVDAASATQDVAVSVAFLVTEIVEYSMLCAPESGVEIALRRDGTTARLTVRSGGLKAGVPCPDVDARQFERVTTGLARQLRSTLDRDGETGTYALNLPVLADDDG